MSTIWSASRGAYRSLSTCLMPFTIAYRDGRGNTRHSAILEAMSLNDVGQRLRSIETRMLWVVQFPAESCGVHDPCCGKGVGCRNDQVSSRSERPPRGVEEQPHVVDVLHELACRDNVVHLDERHILHVPNDETISPELVDPADRRFQNVDTYTRSRVRGDECVKPVPPVELFLKGAVVSSAAIQYRFAFDVHLSSSCSRYIGIEVTGLPTGAGASSHSLNAPHSDRALPLLAPRRSVSPGEMDGK